MAMLLPGETYWEPGTGETYWYVAGQGEGVDLACPWSDGSNNTRDRARTVVRPAARGDVDDDVITTKLSEPPGVGPPQYPPTRAIAPPRSGSGRLPPEPGTGRSRAAAASSADEAELGARRSRVEGWGDPILEPSLRDD